MSSSCGAGDGPISGVCIVADHTRAPSGYTVIRKAYDDPTRDADLHRDGIFRRIDRYMCVTRYPFPNVVEDIILTNSTESPPPGYTALLITVDTKESTTSKKTICVRMSQRVAGLKAVGDIIFLSKQKRPPPGYSLVGEINGLLMCYCEWVVGNQGSRDKPPAIKHTQSLQPEPKNQPVRSSLYSVAEKLLQSHIPKESYMDKSFDSMTIQRDDFGWGIISSIPFHFKQNFEVNKSGEYLSFPPLNPPAICTSLNEIDRKYNYEFRLERAWISS